MSSEIKPLACCDEFQRAHELSGLVIRDSHVGRWHMGHDLRSINFCPWCGASVRTPHPLELAAQDVIENLYCDDDKISDLKSAVINLALVLVKMNPDPPRLPVKPTGDQ